MEMVNQDIVDHLNDVYELGILAYGGLRVSEFPFFLKPIGLPDDFYARVTIEDTDIEKGIKWKLDLGEFEGRLGSLTSGSKTVKQGQKYKHRHEFVCEALQLGGTDVKLSKIKVLNDDDDKRTPDFIFFGEKAIHVVEVATMRSDRDDLVMGQYHLKEFSYLSALQARLENNIITYTVIVVTPYRVASSIMLPETLVLELLARMRIGLALDAKASELGIDMQEDERKQMAERLTSEIYTNISKIGYKKTSDNPLIIDQNYIDTCLEPANEEKVIEALLDEISASRDEITTKLDKNLDEELDDYFKEFKKGKRRYDKKLVTIFPFINTEETEPSSDIPKVSISDCDELQVISKLWSHVMDQYEISPYKEEEDPTTLLAEALEVSPENIRLMESRRKEKRRFYHRVNIEGVLDENDRQALAIQGVKGKRYKNDDFMKARRIHQQSGFTWNTDTSDIEQYLNSDVGLESAKVRDDPKMTLLKHANKLAGNSGKGTDIIDKWRKTKLYQAMDIISDISYEVAVSNKQHCKPNEMILKKLRKYNIYLLISPTNSSEHTFLSIYIPKPCLINFNGVYGKIYACRNGYMTDFVSIKQGKLENQSSMPASLISLASFWSWFYGLDDASPDSFKSCPEALYMLQFSLLVRLEDKAQTEETITHTRYMYMEVFKSYFSVVPPKPFKMLSKITTFPRSRLNLFCIKKIVNSFKEMCNHPPERIQNVSQEVLEEGEDSLPNDSWEGLLNWVTGRPVYTATKAINLVYLGYLKNKMESPEGNTDFQLVEKTCEEEFKLDWENIQRSRGEGEGRPKEKQFNMNCLRHGSDVLISRLRNLYGSDWQKVVRDDIITSLGKRMTLEMATLKASADIEHKSDYEEAGLKNTIGAGRIKVLESVMKHLTEVGLNPITGILGIIEKIEKTSKGVICDLFKKQQHGGLREIYVLTLESRVVQLYIETISRTICSYFEEETLTHPKNKLRKLDEHRSNTARIASRDNCIYADYCSSSDKTRWNQNLTMTALAVPLFKITPKEFHNSIARILNMWTLKLIKLPQRVLNLLINSVEMTSETFKKLLKEFWKPSPKNSIFRKKFDMFITLSAGMMQGILHFTSSLLHLVFLNSMNKIIVALLKRLFPKFSFLMTQVCSSDDSATILTVFSPKDHRNLDKDTYKVCMRASQILEILNNMAPYYCMKNSVKSTTGLIDYVEFNSEFLFRNTIAIPVIKFVTASLNLTESESYLERFHTMYNLTSDLFSSGFPAQNTHLCQLAQGLNHYKTMGSNINPLFEFYAECIINIPDPILGFFLLDTEFCPGVLGFSYSFWKCTTESMVLKRSLKSLISDAQEVIDGGGIVQSLIIKHGEVYRWKRMVQSVSKGVDYISEIEKSPQILYFPPKTVPELRLALVLKATMPSVAISMRGGNSYLQALAMSVYSINTQCFSKTTVTQDLTGKMTRDFGKTSLLREVKDRITELEETHVEVSNDSLEMTFPAIERYKEAQKIIDDLKTYELIQCPKFRHRRTEVHVQPFSSFVPVSLLDICKNLWFGHEVKTSKTILDRCLNAYRLKLPWIKETEQESLRASPFTTHQELANFICSHTIKTRTYVRVGPGIYSKRFSGQLYHLIKKSQKEGFILKCRPERNVKKISKEYKGHAETINQLALALALPSEKERNSRVRKVLTLSPKMYDSIESIQRMSKRDSNLAYIQGFLKKDFSMQDITTSMQQTGHGLVFGYTRLQKRKEVKGEIKWEGEGECYVTCDNGVILVRMKDDEAISIETARWRMVRGHSSTISKVLRELRLNPKMNWENPLRYKDIKPVARFNGTHWCPVSVPGTPVYENADLRPRIREVEDVKLEIKFQSINLTQMTPRGRASMLRYKTYPGDVSLNPSSIRGTDLSDCWVQQKTLKPEYGIAKILGTARRQISMDENKWIMNTLLARLSQKGLTRGPGELSRWIPLIDLDQQDQPIKVTPELMEKIALEMWSDKDDLFGIHIDKLSRELPSQDLAFEEEFTTPLSEEAEQWAFVLHNCRLMEIEENVDITSRGVKSFKYLHPIWDDTIEALENEFRGFWEEVFKGYEVPGLLETSRALIDLFNLRKAKRPSTIEQRAKLLLKSPSIEEEQLEPIKSPPKQQEMEEPTPSTSGTQKIITDDQPMWADEPSSEESDLEEADPFY